MQRESKQFQNKIVNESYLQIFSDMANKELQDGHYEEAIQLFLQTCFDVLHNNSKKYIFDLILEKKYQEAIDYLEQITIHKIKEQEHKEFIKKNKKNSYYLPPTIGYRYALLKYYEQLNKSTQAAEVHQNLQNHLMQIASVEQSIPVSEKTIDYLFDLPTQIKINIEFSSVLPINTVKKIIDKYGEIIAEYFLDANKGLCFVAYRSSQFVLNFTESFPYHKILMKGGAPNISIKLTGKFYSKLQAIATKGIDDLIVQSNLNVRNTIIGPDCNLVIEKNVRVKVGNVTSDYSIQVNSIAMRQNSKLRGTYNLIILAKSLTDLRGSIKAKKELRIGTKRLPVDAIYLQGKDLIKAKKTRIHVKKMMMVDKACIDGGLSIHASESFIAEKSTLITKELECNHIILFSIRENESFNQDVLCELSITNGNAPILIKRNNQFYLYRYYQENEICVAKFKEPPVDINKLNFSNSPISILVENIPFRVMTAIKNHGGYNRSRFTLRTPKAQFYGEINHDVVSIMTDEFTNHESSIFTGEETVKIRTTYYTNKGAIESNTEGGSLEIRFRGYCKNGLTRLSDLSSISKLKLPKTAIHRAWSVTLFGTMKSEINANRVATKYRSVCIGNVKIINHNDIQNENETELFLLKLIDLPNVSEIIKDIKQMMSKVSKGDFSSLKSTSNNITSDNVFNFLFFLIRRIFPAIGSLVNIALNLSKLLFKLPDFKDNVIKFWNTTDDIDITDIIELLEPVISSFAPAVALASQLSDSIDHGVIGGLSPIQDSDSVFVRESKEQQNLGVLLSCQNPVKDLSSAIGLVADVAALAAPNSTHNSVFSAEFGSFTLTGTKSDNSVFRVSEYNLDCALTSVEYSGWSREQNREIVRNSSKTAYRLDLRNNNGHAQNLYYSAPCLILDDSTEVDADSLSLNTRQLPIYKYLNSEEEFKNIHAHNKSAEVDSKIALDREFTNPGSINLTTRNKEGIVVSQRVKTESLSLRAPQGEVKIEADIESENDNSFTAGKGISATPHITLDNQNDEPILPKWSFGFGIDRMNPSIFRPGLLNIPPPESQRIHIVSRNGGNSFDSGYDIEIKAADVSAGKNNHIQAAHDAKIDGQEIQKNINRLSVLSLMRREIPQIERKATNIQSGGTSRLNANHDMTLSDVDIKADRVLAHADHDLTKTATHFQGRLEVRTTAGHDLNDQCRQMDVTNPLGGTKALWIDSTSMSDEGSVTERAGHFLYLDGNLVSKTETTVGGDEGMLITALIKEYIAAREHHSSWFGLVESDKTRISHQVHQPLVASATGKTVIDSAHGKGVLKGVLLLSPDGTVDACYQGIDNKTILVSDVTHEESNILGGLLSHSNKTVITQRDVPTQLFTHGVSEFRTYSGGINLQSILIYGDGSVILNAPGQSVRLTAPILHQTSKTKQRGFHVSLESPLLSAVQNVVADAKQALASGSVTESAVNGLALGADAVNAAAQVQVTREALTAAHSLRELANAIPVSLRVGFGVEETDTYSETVGQGALSVNRLEVTGKSFTVADGFNVDVDTLVLHTPEVSVTGAELTDTEQRQAIDVSVDLSLQGVQGSDVTVENASTRTVHHVHSQLKAVHALLDVDKFTCHNGDFEADDVEGNVNDVDVRSSQDTLQQTSEVVTVSSGGAGVDTSTADVAVTHFSHFNVKYGHNLAVGHVNLEGGTFKAPDAKVGSVNETTVYDHAHTESFGLSVSFPTHSSHNDNPIGVPVRGHFQQGVHEWVRDAAGDRVLRGDEIGYNFVVPVVHAEIHQPQLPVPKIEDSTVGLSHELSITDSNFDPLTYDPEADLNATFKSFNFDDKHTNTSQSDSNSLPMAVAYAEVGECLKHAIWGAGRAIQHAVAFPIELVGDLEIIAYKKMFGNTGDNRLPKTIYADYYDLASSRMDARKSAFLQFGDFALDASVVGVCGAPPWTIRGNTLYQNALDRQVTRLSGLLDYASTLSGPELVGAASYQLTSFFLPGLPYIGLKAMDNYHRFGVATLPRFRNIKPDDILIHPVPSISFDEIRATMGKREYIFTATPDGEMQFAPRVLEKPIYFNGRELNENHHTDISNGRDVVLAGAFITQDGYLINVDNFSGHYLPYGNHLHKLAEELFARKGFSEIKGKFERWEDRFGPATYQNNKHNNKVPFYDSRIPIYVSGSTHTLFNSSNRVHESMSNNVQSLNDGILYAGYNSDHTSTQTEDRNNDESTYELMKTTTKESFLKMLKSLDNEVKSFRHLRQCATAEMYIELADEALLSEDKFSTRLQKIEQTASRFLASSACAKRAFTLFRSIPAASQTPLAYAALPIIIWGSYKTCGNSAEKAVTLAYDNVDMSAFDDAMYQQTFMNL